MCEVLKHITHKTHKTHKYYIMCFKKKHIETHNLYMQEEVDDIYKNYVLREVFVHLGEETLCVFQETHNVSQQLCVS